jgi:hypothetical protein
MIDLNTPIACLTVGQFIDLLKDERRKPDPPKRELPKYLTPNELADLIKKKLSTVYQNHSSGLIPGSRKVGNRLLFDTETILNWIENGSQKIETTKNL